MWLCGVIKKKWLGGDAKGINPAFHISAPDFLFSSIPPSPLSLPSHESIESPRGGKSAIGDGVSWTTPCKRKAQPEAQLGDRRSQSDEPRRGSVVAKVSDYIHRRVSAIPPRPLLTAAQSRSFFGEADFLFSSIPLDITK